MKHTPKMVTRNIKWGANGAAPRRYVCRSLPFNSFKQQERFGRSKGMGKMATVLVPGCAFWIVLKFASRLMSLKPCTVFRTLVWLAQDHWQAFPSLLRTVQGTELLIHPQPLMRIIKESPDLRASGHLFPHPVQLLQSPVHHRLARATQDLQEEQALNFHL